MAGERLITDRLLERRAEALSRQMQGRAKRLSAWEAFKAKFGSISGFTSLKDATLAEKAEIEARRGSDE